MKQTLQKLFANPYVVLSVATWFWAGNTIAGRLAVNQISPVSLTSLRYLVVLLCLLPFTGKELVRCVPQARPFTWKLIWMGTIGFTGFSFFIYLAAHSTGAANISIIQGVTPAIVMLGAFLLYKTPITLKQVLGLIVAFSGVVAIGIQGNFANLKAFSFVLGDIWMVIAATLYAIYTLGLRNRPPLKGLVFFTALTIVAFLASLFLLGNEIMHGEFYWPTPQGWLILLYVALFPSLLSQICYIRGVELIGPARAGLFINLIPVFGTMMAAFAPNEPFAFYHVVGLLLVLIGIILAEHK